MALKPINQANARIVLESMQAYGKSSQYIIHMYDLGRSHCVPRYHHATFAKGGPDSNRGANPELRLLFYRAS